MALIKDEVLILKSINFSEADKILSVFGRNKGRFGLMAKGVRKLESKNRGNIQTGMLSKISYYEGQSLGVLREADSLIVLDLSPRNLDLLNNTLYLLYNLMPEEEQDEEIFSLIKNLYETGFGLRDVNRFRVKVLRHLGYLPDLTSCSLCQKSPQLMFMNITDFRMSCTSCYDKLNETEKVSWEKIDELRYESPKMNQAIDNYVRRVVEEN